MSRSRHPHLNALGVSHRPASVTDASALHNALADIDVVYHLAGLVSRDPKDAERMRQVHVVGTETTLRVASEVGVRRVIYASSTGTFGCSRDPKQIPHEDGPDASELVGRWAYYRTKLEAERLALASRPQDEMEVIVLNPSLLLGPGDFEGSSTTDVQDFLEGRLPAVARGGLNFVDVRDVADAFVAAADAGRPGVRHLLGALNLSVADLMGRLAQITGRSGPRFSPPAGIQVGASVWAARLARLVGREPGLDPATAAMAQLFWYASGQRARQELGFQSRDPNETLADTVAFLRNGGKYQRGA